MKTISFYTSLVLLAILTTATGFAKDDKKKDKDKDKDKDRDRDRVVVVERDRKDYDRSRDHDHDYDYRDGRRRDDGDRRYYQDRTRSIYVIERDRPVQRVVFIDSDGRYYRVIDGRRMYIRDRYYESYPSKYYYPDGRRRVTITLPF